MNLDSSEKDFEALINAIPHLAWMATPDGDVYWFNDRFYEYTGKTFEEVKNPNSPILRDEKSRKEIADAWVRSFTTGTPFECLEQIRRRDGRFRWFMMRALPVHDDTGAITRWVGTCTDVDEQTNFQRQLTDTLEIMSDTFLAIDKSWTISQVNAVLLRETGLQREDLVGRDFRDVFLSYPGGHESKYWTEYHRLMRDRVPVAFEEFHEPYGMWTSTRAYPTSEGGFTIFSVDITAKKRAEEEMRKTKEEAERANALKSAFLANMSHEIRTPLGAMLGFADLLRDPGLSAAERSSYLDILTRNGRQLSVIIDDILDLSKVEAGHLSLEFVPTSPESIAADVIALMMVKARDKELKLDYASDISTPKLVTSDPGRVRQVLLNLVTNAVKFTLAGSVQISSSGFVDSEGRQMVSFKVSDSGIGIDSAQQERIFGSFVQADGSMTRRFGGTGLGLALSRRLACALGGNVVLESSALNRGSTFTFTFQDRPEKRVSDTPRSLAASSPAQTASAKTSLRGTKVLIVDDSLDNQQIISTFLTKAGVIVTAAANGVEGSDKALAGDYDLILMDIQMPIMDGYTATRLLRERGYKKPIIALTAHAMNEDRKRALEIGCTDHLPKPIVRETLIETVARYATEAAMA